MRGGAFVILGHDGDVRIERGFLRPDEKPRTDAAVDAEVPRHRLRIAVRRVVTPGGRNGEGDGDADGSSHPGTPAQSVKTARRRHHRGYPCARCANLLRRGGSACGWRSAAAVG